MRFDERKARGTARYKRLRLKVLRRAGWLCEICWPLSDRRNRNGIRSAATELDHIRPAHGRADLFWDENNCQGACRPCHEEKTGVENSRDSKPRGSEAWDRHIEERP